MLDGFSGGGGSRDVMNDVAPSDLCTASCFQEAALSSFRDRMSAVKTRSLGLLIAVSVTYSVHCAMLFRAEHCAKLQSGLAFVCVTLLGAGLCAGGETFHRFYLVWDPSTKRHNPQCRPGGLFGETQQSLTKRLPLTDCYSATSGVHF